MNNGNDSKTHFETAALWKPRSQSTAIQMGSIRYNPGASTEQHLSELQYLVADSASSEFDGPSLPADDDAYLGGGDGSHNDNWD